MLTPTGCQARQQRLQWLIADKHWDLFLTTDYRTVYYFTGLLHAPETPCAFVLWHGGQSLLASPSKEEAVAQKRIELETYSIERLIDYPERELLRKMADPLAARPWKRGGAELRHSLLLSETVGRLADATDAIIQLRRHKEVDEIQEIRTSLHYIKLAYEAARRTIAPGLREVDVYAAMYDAIIKEAGTAVEFKGDFACGQRCIKGGGPPTNRVLEEGDLYILDLFPAPALYFGDTCRTFAVGTPSALQREAFALVIEAVKLAEGLVRPGVAVKDVYQKVKDFLDSHAITEKSFWHHLGHGIGHRGHEAPRIIPGSNEVFKSGDVITLEPGIYSEALHGGIRLEDNYIVREHGLENLFDYPMSLT